MRKCVSTFNQIVLLSHNRDFYSTPVELGPLVQVSVLVQNLKHLLLSFAGFGECYTGRHLTLKGVEEDSRSMKTDLLGLHIKMSRIYFSLEIFLMHLLITSTREVVEVRQ